MSQPNYEESRLWPSRWDKSSCDPQVALIWPRESLDECHDATEENGISSNTPYNVHIEEETRHGQDKDNE